MISSQERIELSNVEIKSNSIDAGPTKTGIKWISEANVSGTSYMVEYFPNPLEKSDDHWDFIRYREEGLKFKLWCNDFILFFDRIWHLSESEEKKIGRGFRCLGIAFDPECSFRFSSVIEFENTLILFAKIFQNFNRIPELKLSEKQIKNNQIRYFEIDQQFDFSFDWGRLLNKKCESKMSNASSANRYWRFEV